MTNLQQLRDAIMSIWTKHSEECFQRLVESMPRRIKAVLKVKGVQPATSKMYLIKWPVSVYAYIYIYIYIHRQTVHSVCKKVSIKMNNINVGFILIFNYLININIYVYYLHIQYIPILLYIYLY